MENLREDTSIRDELKRRASALATVIVSQEDDLEQIEVMPFQLASETYALETRFIRAVWPLTSYLPIPHTPPFVLGVANVHGEICSVIDLKVFFSLPSGGITNLNKLVILEQDNMFFGILADDVQGARLLGTKSLSSAENWKGIDNTYITGITEERMIVLNAEHILNDKRLIVNDLMDD